MYNSKHCLNKLSNYLYTFDKFYPNQYMIYLNKLSRTCYWYPKSIRSHMRGKYLKSYMYHMEKCIENMNCLTHNIGQGIEVSIMFGRETYQIGKKCNYWQTLCRNSKHLSCTGYIGFQIDKKWSGILQHKYY